MSRHQQHHLFCARTARCWCYFCFARNSILSRSAAVCITHISFKLCLNLHNIRTMSSAAFQLALVAPCMCVYILSKSICKFVCICIFYHSSRLSSKLKCNWLQFPRVSHSALQSVLIAIFSMWNRPDFYIFFLLRFRIVFGVCNKCNKEWIVVCAPTFVGSSIAATTKKKL